MTAPRAGERVGEDPSLDIPDLPPLRDPPLQLDNPLRRMLPTDASFRLTGRRASLTGSGAGIGDVRVDGRRIASGIVALDAELVSGWETPLGIERRLSFGGHTLLQRAIVARTAGAVVLEWVAPEDEVGVDLRWMCELSSVDPVARPSEVRFRTAAGRLLVAGPGGRRVVFALDPAPGSFEVEDSPETGRAALRIAARCCLRRGEPLRLVIAGGAADAETRSALAVAARPAALVAARRGHARRLEADRVGLRGPDASVDPCVGWAKHDLDALTQSQVPDARVALVALPAGDFDAARRALTRIGENVASEPVAEVLLSARYLAWTGDVATVRRQWPRIRALARRSAHDVPPAVVSELRAAAEAIGEPAPLEVEGGADAGGEEAGAVSIENFGPGAAIAEVIYGILGTEPDAARGRLVLRPEPPAGWSSFTVSELRVGDARLRVEYQATGERHLFRLTQTRGPAPLRVILEPLLPGRALRSARVDGEEAELDARPRGDKLRIPVQVVLDHVREVVLEVEASGATERRAD